MKPEEIADGIYYDMPEAQYRALPFAHYSAVKSLCLGKTPAHYIALRDNIECDSDSKAFGRLVHEALLTPQVIERTERLPDNIKSRRGAEWERLRDAFPEKTFLPPSEWATFQRERDVAYRVRDSILNHPIAGELMRDISTEVVIIWTDKETGVRCKGRIDILGKNSDYLGDIKTTSKFIPYQIAKSGYYFGYHIQSAMYTDAVCQLTGKDLDNPMPFWFIFVESEYPHLVSLYNGHSAFDERNVTMDVLENVDEEIGYLAQRKQELNFLEFGREQYKAALRTIANCEMTGEWEGHPFSPLEMVIPKWAGSEGAF